MVESQTIYCGIGVKPATIMSFPMTLYKEVDIIVVSCVFSCVFSFDKVNDY